MAPNASPLPASGNLFLCNVGHYNGIGGQQPLDGTTRGQAVLCGVGQVGGRPLQVLMDKGILDGAVAPIATRVGLEMGTDEVGRALVAYKVQWLTSRTTDAAAAKIPQQAKVQRGCCMGVASTGTN